MSDPIVSVNGIKVSYIDLIIPYSGRWNAHVDLMTDEVPTGPCTLTVGDMTLAGTYQGQGTRAWLGVAKATIVGGAGRIEASVRGKHYHADNGVKAKTVITDLCREAGETVTISPSTGNVVVGIDFARIALSARHALDYVCTKANNSVWWVDETGMIQVAPTRPHTAIDSKVEILSYEPRHVLATVEPTIQADIMPGRIVSDRLPAPVLIRQVRIQMEGKKLSTQIWGVVA